MPTLQILRSCGTCCVLRAPTNIIHPNMRIEHHYRDIFPWYRFFAVASFSYHTFYPPFFRRVLGSLYLSCYMREAVVCLFLFEHLS